MDQPINIDRIHDRVYLRELKGRGQKAGQDQGLMTALALTGLNPTGLYSVGGLTDAVFAGADKAARQRLYSALGTLKCRTEGEWDKQGGPEVQKSTGRGLYSGAYWSLFLSSSGRIKVKVGRELLYPGLSQLTPRLSNSPSGIDVLELSSDISKMGVYDFVDLALYLTGGPLPNPRSWRNCSGYPRPKWGC